MNPVSLGQHFLTNKGIARKMADLLLPIEGPILEIGPGKGILTRFLIEHGGEQEIILVELDRGLYLDLKKKFPSHCTLINANILDIQLQKLPLKKNIICVGNIPYYISKDLIDWTIQESGKIKRGLYMMQKEYVEKLIPRRKSKKNFRSLMFQFIFELQKKFDVQPGSFSPPPSILSTVFLFRKKSDLPPPSYQIEFYQFLKFCFSNRRKTLKNTLLKLVEKEKLSSIFRSQDISPAVRADQLELPDFVGIYDKLRD
jgi:16S rRNA (adenine1518-N6/adenine1519-N6)-dimethyltransferase